MKVFCFHIIICLQLVAIRATGFEGDVSQKPTTTASATTSTPIVGILAQETSGFVRRKFPDENYNSYIAASYVKFVESAGGRVVPIWINQTREYYEDLLSKINGVLLPGGATYYNKTFGYGVAGKHIYEIAVEMNERGEYMPIWGTCLGFELLVYLTSNNHDYRIGCAASRVALPLDFQPNYKKSRMFGSASNDIINYFENYPVTANFHIFCYTPEIFEQSNQTDIWDVMSVEKDNNGVEFISTIEHKKYPFFGVQFHPEKNLFEFKPGRNIPHIIQAIYTSQYLADFFANETRKNKNHFGNISEETDLLIYNYKTSYTGKLGSAFEQLYLFGPSSSLRSSACSIYMGAWMIALQILGLFFR